MMGDEHISHGLAVLAEDMPTPDIGDIVATSRTHIRRRRAVTATWIGAATVVGMMAGIIAVVGDHASVSAADGSPTTSTRPSIVPNNTPIVDDRARSLDQQLNKIKSEVLPAGMAISPDPYDTITVDGHVLVLEFVTTEQDDSGQPLGPPLFTGRGYTASAKLSDTQGWGTMEIQIEHKNPDDKAAHLATCATLPGTNCQANQLPDGTKTAVSSYESGRGYPNSGTDIRMDALRPDGTFIDILCTNLPFPTGQLGPNNPPTTQPTRPQPPLSQTDLLKLATAFTY